MRVAVLLTIGIAGIAGCTTATAPRNLDTNDAAHNFRIVLDQSEYRRSADERLLIAATVTNSSPDVDFYANVGDGFNAALEQSNIFAARGTHAWIERRTADAGWQDATTSVLIEGSRVVVLRAGQSYRLVGDIAPIQGIYRIRLDYSPVDDSSPPPPLHDYSATFRVR